MFCKVVIGVKEGYKKSELGYIPKDWKLTHIKDIFERIVDKNKNNESNNVLTISAQLGLVNQEKFFNKSVASKNTSNYYLLKKGDFAYNKSYSAGYPMGTIKKLNAYDNGIVSPLYICFRLKNKEMVSEFYEHFFEYNMFDKAIASIAQEGARNHGLLNVSVNEFFNLPIIVPTKEEQEKIALILSTVDEQIDNTEKLIQKNQELKKGLMQQLLTNGIGHTKFKETEIGEIPEEWDVKKVGDICEVKGGKRLPKGYQLEDEDNAFPYIRVADMYMGGIRQDDIKYVPKDIVDKIKNYKISKDDLFISVAGTLGIVGQVPYELDGANLTENADKLCNIQINKLYLMKVLQSNIIQSIIEAEQTKSAQPKLALTRIKEFLIPVPSDIEQVMIASILVEVDEKIEEYENKKQKLEELKKGLMQQLLTGNIRVV